MLSKSHWLTRFIRRLVVSVSVGRRRRAVPWLLVAALCAVPPLLLLLFAVQSGRPPAAVDGLRVFVASNQHQSAAILPNFRRELLRLAAAIGPANLYVSIYENGSTDETKELLEEMRVELTARGIPNRILMDHGAKNFTRRIPYLAPLRNIVLQPLRDWWAEGVAANRGNDFGDHGAIMTKTTVSKLLFLNDVVWTAEDALKLLTARNYHYDAVCGMDMSWHFYDTFATRDAVSSAAAAKHFSYPPSELYPYFRQPDSAQSVRDRRLVEVFSCWNGMAAFDPWPFVLKQDPVEFRALLPEVDDLPYEASECCLVFSDMRQRGYTRILLDTSVYVYYDGVPGQWWFLLQRFWDWLVGWRRQLELPKPQSAEYVAFDQAWHRAAADNVSALDRVCVQPVFIARE